MDDLAKMKERRRGVIRRARARLFSTKLFMTGGHDHARKRHLSQFDIEFQQQKEMMVVIRELHTLRDRQMKFKDIPLNLKREQPFPIISKRAGHNFKALRIDFNEQKTSEEVVEDRKEIEKQKNIERQIKKREANMQRIKEWRKVTKEQMKDISLNRRHRSRPIKTPKYFASTW